MYTTVTKVRESSGFVGNDNVTDAFISGLITRSAGIINGKIRDIYAFPLPRLYEQQIVFSGTGTGSGTMTITIDGEDYAVAIVSGRTPGQAADLFRTAALDNASFKTDGIGNGATVRLWTLGYSDPAGVTIGSTDPQTVAGITATGGTVTVTAPPLLEYLGTEIAVALLLKTEFGPEAQDSDKDGGARLDDLMEMLNDIQSKKVKLEDFAGNELPRSPTKKLSFFPTSRSKCDPSNPTGNRVTMNRKF